MNFFAHFHTLDRRVIYAVLVLAMIATLITQGGTVAVSNATKDAHDQVERLVAENAKAGAQPATRGAPGTGGAGASSAEVATKAGGAVQKIALVVCDAGGATIAENVPQAETVIRHLMSRHIKVAFMCLDPQGKEIAQEIGGRVGAALGKRYGEDWCNLGYYLPMQVLYQTLVKNFYEVVKQDIRGTPVAQILMMRPVKNIHDIGLIFHVSGSNSLDGWLLFVKNSIRAPIVAGCTGILNSQYANYCATGQLNGYLGGMAGAAEYEQLSGVRGGGTRGMQVQNYGHLLIIGFIVLGNIGYFVSKRRAGRQDSRRASPREAGGR